MTILRFTVTDADTAIALGSGDVPVLATPRLVAWMEAATVAAASTRVDTTSTTVGTEVWLRHRRPSAVGALIEVEVTEVTEQDRGLSFAVVAREVPPAEPGEPGPGEPDPVEPSGQTGVGRDPEPGQGESGPEVDRGREVEPGREIASGRVVRAIVDRGAFLGRL